MSKKPFSFRDFFGFGRKEGNALNESPASSCGSGSGCGGGSCPSTPPPQEGGALHRPANRREALGFLGLGAATVAAAVGGGCGKDDPLTEMKFAEYFKKNYRLMTEEERRETVRRIEILTEAATHRKVHVKDTAAQPGVRFGYAFNISRCKGYGECIEACVKENNQDRGTNMQYIRIFEVDKGQFSPEHGKTEYIHEVGAPGKFYMGTQCFQCGNPPCTKVCPVGATWQEPDGLVVVDYNWCIGCRYCEAACPYWARRFNWQEPQVPAADINPNQHYLGNRLRRQGAMEKCTWCIARSRDGRQPACAEACPTGARVFGNILDPDSEISYILKNKKVFRLKEDLGTEPHFWYYMD
ncbi:MAG: hypothetical protein RL095_3292 [Verrucomicrobiota bacterium]|jgi:molybdopterin-containing oxidoreductase family iron-sulfur binding subunit